MTVAELIEKLKKYPLEREVYGMDQEYDLATPLVFESEDSKGKAIVVIDT